MSPPAHHLTSIVFSHYVEKARWALDRYAVPYRESRYMPFFHVVPVFLEHQGRKGSADKASSRFSTPVLRTPDNRLICDSGAIVRHVSATHAPAGEELFPDDTDTDTDLEGRLHDRLGPHSRRVVYATCIQAPALLQGLAQDNVGPLQAGLFRAFTPVGLVLLRRMLHIDAATVQRSTEIVRQELDAVSAILADGRPYLTGDRFTGVDLSFACMAAAVVLPEQYGAALPTADQLPDRFRVLVEESRATPAGAFALRLFREERGRVVGQRTG